jgi:hypothetical protein
MSLIFTAVIGGRCLTLSPVELAGLLLSLTAILVVAFTIFLSWQLYRKSQHAVSSMRDNMIRVDEAIRGLKNDIATIANDAVEHWARFSGVAPASKQDPTAQLDKSVATLEEKFASLKNGENPALKASVSESLEEIRVLQREITKERQSAIEALKELQCQAVFPNLPRTLTRGVEQTTTSKGDHIALDYQGRIRNSGFLDLHVSHNVFRVEAVFTFAAKFRSAPRPTVKVVATPAPITPRAIEHTVGVTAKTMRVTLLRPDRNLLPAGTYVIEYRLHSAEPHSNELAS